MSITLRKSRKHKRLHSGFLTPGDYADQLGITRMRVYKWIERGHLTVYVVGSERRPTYLIPRSELKVGRKRV